ncbi:MAG: hypothetical protein UY96_C0022G0002 [Parcubacteria group bacterium GW2011_GWB1_56_8]|nr:MAG: hypothetical protein UY96_C0022G0002 [Parcubacteria group bacterium GW2011_GWB1_56_8]
MTQDEKGQLKALLRDEPSMRLHRELEKELRDDMMQRLLTVRPDDPAFAALTQFHRGCLHGLHELWGRREQFVKQPIQGGNDDK